MTKDELLSQLIGILREEFDEGPPNEIQPGSTLREIKGWSSIGILFLTERIRQVMHIDLASNEVKNFTTVNDLARFLHNQTQK